MRAIVRATLLLLLLTSLPALAAPLTMLRIEAVQAVPDFPEVPVVLWDTSTIDDVSAWSASFPGDIVIPAGVKRARFTIGSRWSFSPEGARRMWLSNVGSGWPTEDGVPYLGWIPTESNTGRVNSGAWLPVTPGDIWRVYVNQDSGGDLGILPQGTFVQIEWLPDPRAQRR